MSFFSVPSTAPIIFFSFYSVVTPGGTNWKDRNRWRQLYAWKTSSPSNISRYAFQQLHCKDASEYCQLSTCNFFFFNLFCLHCLHELFASNLKPLCGDNLLGAARSRGFVVASITDSTCNLLWLMAWGHCIALIQLCMDTIPFPPWHSFKEAFAS